MVIFYNGVLLLLSSSASLGKNEKLFPVELSSSSTCIPLTQRLMDPLDFKYSNRVSRILFITQFFFILTIICAEFKQVKLLFRMLIKTCLDFTTKCSFQNVIIENNYKSKTDYLFLLEQYQVPVIRLKPNIYY